LGKITDRNKAGKGYKSTAKSPQSPVNPTKLRVNSTGNEAKNIPERLLNGNYYTSKKSTKITILAPL